MPAMRAESILIERMAGKSTVGMQVPNAERETIWLRDMMEDQSFIHTQIQTDAGDGQGHQRAYCSCRPGDHAACADRGFDRSGKSVADQRDDYVGPVQGDSGAGPPDSRRSEAGGTGMYEGVPHLFTPIITEPKLAANALRNAVREMERRLKLLASRSVRNMEQYNRLFEMRDAEPFRGTGRGRKAAAANRHYHRRTGRSDDARPGQCRGVDHAAGADGPRCGNPSGAGDAAAFGGCDYRAD